jgi:hypothetical protein
MMCFWWRHTSNNSGFSTVRRSSFQLVLAEEGSLNRNTRRLPMPVVASKEKADRMVDDDDDEEVYNMKEAAGEEHQSCMSPVSSRLVDNASSLEDSLGCSRVVADDRAS